MPNPFKNREIDWAVEQYRRPEKNSRNQSGKNGRADTSPAFTARGIQAEREERIAQEEYKRYKRESPLGTGREAAEKAAREEYERFTNDEPLGTGWWTSRGVPKDQAEYLVQQKYVKEKTREYMDMHYPQRYAEKLAEQAYKKAKKEYDKGMGQRWQNMVAAEKEADRQRHISDIQNRTYEDPAPGVSIEMLDAARKTATDVEESLLLTQMYNGKVLSHYAEIFANTQMDGTDHSVLDEIKLLAIMDGGKEKKERKEAALQKMDELGMKDGLNELFYPHFAGDGSFDLKTFGKWLRSSAEAGASGFFKSTADTADVTLGSALTGVGWEDNPVSKWAEYAGDNYASWKYNSNLYAEKLGGGGWDFGGETVEAAVGALPQFALALMTKGASLAASEGSLATTAAYETGGALTKVGLTTEAMMKNPQFWASFSRTLGSDYKAAKEMGVSDEVAAMGSVVTSLLNAGIEIGPDGKSGIQGLPYQTSDVWTLEGVTQGLESVFQEGGEEGLQKFVNEIVAKYLYGSEEPILVPEEYMWDMGVGAASGALLGGGKTATEMAVDAISGKNLGNGWHNAGNYASQEGLSVMDSLNEAGLYGSESLAQSSPGAYSLYIQEAKDNGASTDQALKYATAATAMEIGTRNMPIDMLLDSMDGDPKTAAQVMDDVLKQSGIEMTPMELKWLGDVAAKVSALQQNPDFATEIALEMLSGKSGQEAQAAASKTLWEDVLNREIVSRNFKALFSQNGNPDMGNQTAAGDELVPQQGVEGADLPVINEQTGATQQTVETTQKSPTYEELVQKEDIPIVDVGGNTEGKTYAQLKADVFNKALTQKWYDAPYINKDTGMPVFLTKKSLTHAFSNLSAQFGTDTILAMGSAPELIQNAVLTDIASPKNPAKAETRVFTFFAAIKGENGIEPVKLKVKEYSSNDSRNILPPKILEYFTKKKKTDTYNTLYDLKALEVVSIESAKKEFGASANDSNSLGTLGTNSTPNSETGASVSVADGLGHPLANNTPNSNISIEDLMDLVKGDAGKYIPKRKGSTEDNP